MSTNPFPPDEKDEPSIATGGAVDNELARTRAFDIHNFTLLKKCHAALGMAASQSYSLIPVEIARLTVRHAEAVALLSEIAELWDAQNGEAKTEIALDDKIAGARTYLQQEDAK